MKVTKISRIRSYRIFRDYSWPSNLDDFGQFNLIYGWNRSGKTTLSTLFRHLQDREPVVEGEVDFEIDGRRISGSDLSSAQLPMVRVFNRDFITATIHAAGEPMDPIFYFGEDSVAKQKQIERLRAELAAADAAVLAARNEKSKSEKALDDYCVEKAKFVKELLISSQSPQYINYDKRSYRQTIGQFTAQSATAASLAADEKESLRKQRDAQLKDEVAPVDVDVPDLGSLETEVLNLTKRSVVSRVIKSLTENADVGTWVQKGLALHSGVHDTRICHFCGQPIPDARIEQLEAHFNDEYKHFQNELMALANRIQTIGSTLSSVAIPDPARMYGHLADDFQVKAADAKDMLELGSRFLDSLRAALLQKHASPFASVSLADTMSSVHIPDRRAMADAFVALNAIIENHNSITRDFANKVKTATETLERCYVAETFDDFGSLSAAVVTAESGLNSVINGPDALKEQIAGIERQILEHLRPAEELNGELRAYLGHDELELDVKDNGYVMMRGGHPAGNLSESERTAIAFLYFLKSLQDKSVSISNSIVVIDDPVSSLDANSLFTAFGYLKERTKTAGQLFILTHSFGFFRQVKNWFHKLPHQKSDNRQRRPARFYLIKVCTSDGQRASCLEPLDPLLEQYESEYHYLFRQIYLETQRSQRETALEEYYGMPNIARRLLETFLAFRFPAIHGELFKQMDAVDFDACKKTKILRFLHTYSHSSSISEAEHDATILSETRVILGTLMELIAHCDPLHYRGMLTLLENDGAANHE